MTADKRDRSRLFWQFQIAGWAIYALLAWLFMRISLGIEDPLFVAIVRTITGFAITSILRSVYRWWTPRTKSIWVLGISVLVLCAAMAMVDDILTQIVIPELRGGIIPKSHEILLLIPSSPMRWMIYWVWSIFYFGIGFWLNAEDAKLLRAKAETEARANELRLLQAQINPHFLFNALNTVLAETENPQTRSLVQGLAEYLRFSVRKHDLLEPLELELEAMEHYLEVEQARLGDRFSFRIEAEPEARAMLVPVAVVQPLVENAIKYGRRTSPKALEVKVEARIVNNGLEIKTTNTGRWIPPEENDSTQTGLENLRRRLVLLYGEEARVNTSSGDGSVSVEIWFPRKSTIYHEEAASLAG